MEGGSLKFRKSGSEVRGEKRKVPSPFVVQSAQDNSEIRRFSIPQRRTRGPLLSNESFKGYKNNGRNSSFSSYPGVKINFLPTRRPIRSKSCRFIASMEETIVRRIGSIRDYRSCHLSSPSFSSRSDRPSIRHWSKERRKEISPLTGARPLLSATIP